MLYLKIYLYIYIYLSIYQSIYLTFMNGGRWSLIRLSVLKTVILHFPHPSLHQQQIIVLPSPQNADRCTTVGPVTPDHPRFCAFLLIRLQEACGYNTSVSEDLLSSDFSDGHWKLECGLQTVKQNGITLLNRLLVWRLPDLDVNRIHSREGADESVSGIPERV